MRTALCLLATAALVVGCDSQSASSDPSLDRPAPGTGNVTLELEQTAGNGARVSVYNSSTQTVYYDPCQTSLRGYRVAGDSEVPTTLFLPVECPTDAAWQPVAPRTRAALDRTFVSGLNATVFVRFDVLVGNTKPTFTSNQLAVTTK